MAKLKLDLHDIYNKGNQIDAELNRIVEDAVDKKIALVASDKAFNLCFQSYQAFFDSVCKTHFFPDDRRQDQDDVADVRHRLHGLEAAVVRHTGLHDRLHTARPCSRDDDLVDDRVPASRLALHHGGPGIGGKKGPVDLDRRRQGATISALPRE